MFSIRQKREIADKVQAILRATNHQELPDGEIQFSLHVDGEEPWSYADIHNNGAVIDPGVNLHNELTDAMMMEPGQAVPQRRWDDAKTGHATKADDPVKINLMGYKDLGWQLTEDTPEMTRCRELGHTPAQVDMSPYAWRGTHIITYCPDCRYLHHCDCSD
jgi:hypothetical protein